MEGPHDLGGMQGLGPVEIEPDEPVFHERWESRVFGTTAGVLLARLDLPRGGGFRHRIERMDAVHYLTSSYYEHWLTALATGLVENEVLDLDELEDRAGGRFPLSRLLANGLDRLVPAEPEPGQPRFAPGDPVRVRDVRFAGHTRCPDYVRGRTGVIVRASGEFPVPEVLAHRGEVVEEATYVVAFTSRELWGTDDRVDVRVELYDRYLDPAGGTS
jgi:nitrile hydratase subunit beta